jgi:DNA-binding NarL/FixJ family response regulator
MVSKKKKSPNKDRCLVVDGNVAIAKSIKSMLIRMGYSESLITLCKTPNMAVESAKKHKYKIVISEYHFGKQINGQKLFEELSYFQTIDHNTIFIIVTSENSLERVAAVVDLNPDNYLLKPFSYTDLKTRVLRAIEGKQFLTPIINRKLANDSIGGIAECDRLLKTRKGFKSAILKYKGQFLSQLNIHDKAVALYNEINKDKCIDRVELGIANSHLYLDKLVDANVLLDKLIEKKPFNTNNRPATVSASMITRNIPRAIEHLEFVNQLIPGNSVRELVFSYLCLAENDTEMALVRYHAYLELNRNTYRDNVFSKLNLLRFFLFTFKVTGKKVDIQNHQFYPVFLTLLNEVFSDTHKAHNLDNEKKAVTAHLLALNGELSKAARLIVDVVSELDLERLNFNFGLHLLILLDQLHLDNLYKSFILSAITQVSKSKDDELIVHSRLHLLERYQKRHKVRAKSLAKALSNIEDATKLDQEGVAYDILSVTLTTYPLLINFSMKYLTFLTRHWPSKKDTSEVISLFMQSLHTIEVLTHSGHDPKYQRVIQQSLKQLKKHLGENEYSQLIKFEQPERSKAEAVC